MQTKITTSGSSAALRIPSAVLRAWGVRVGQGVSVELKDGALVARPSRPRYTLDQLLKEEEGGALDFAWLNDARAEGEEL